MPQLRKPWSLVHICISTTGGYLISQASSCINAKQVKLLRQLVEYYVPPLMLGDVLSQVVRQFAQQHGETASSSTLDKLLQILIQPSLTQVSLSDLTYAGTVSTEDLDTFEDTLLRLLPSLTNLTQLDLSTNHYKMTWPSCSGSVLKIIGRYCPKLQVLDLINNNRVTGEDLLCLGPSEGYPGCVNLEKLFIQDCSIVPLDVTNLLRMLRKLKLVGYKELGSSLRVFKLEIQRLRGKLTEEELEERRLHLTHIDNTMPHAYHSNSEYLKFLTWLCPNIENLRFRLSDDDAASLQWFRRLRHLELRFFTNMHHPLGNETLSYLQLYGHQLLSLAIFLDELHVHHVLTIAGRCLNLQRLFLHANTVLHSSHIGQQTCNLSRLKVISLRIGQDELMQSPLAGCDLLLFLIRPSFVLEEMYLMLRSTNFNSAFLDILVRTVSLKHLKTLICDVPRRTLVAPMLDLTIDTADLIIKNCPNLEVLGNLISWAVQPEQVAELSESMRRSNYNVRIIHSESNKINTKYF